MKPIDKDVLVAELNRLIAELVEEGEDTMFEQGRISAFEDIKLFIDSMKEELINYNTGHFDTGRCWDDGNF